ncbi:hypothetical protein [Marinimicrobium agarilyticum]|uniref:hypothetical protein n=1 Tax=Marinimicrobium agarilyticum TaxID=306546 RepID=UPI0006888200|nr:hypothetical protein [Marinimicrobium agarilyticum]
MIRVCCWLAAGLSLLLTPIAWAQDEERLQGPIIELESQVTGNREQPQVFNVVPWQTPDSPVPGYNPLQRQLDTVFGHLERDELQRSLEQSQESSDVDQ